MTSFSLKLKDGTLKKFSKPCIMGVINTSHDSFYRPMPNLATALFEAEKMIKQGAEILDVGGVATNPFVNLAKSVPSVSQELDRVLPLIEAISSRFDILISLDSSEPEVMRAAVKCGVGFINDQQMLQVPNALETILELQVPVCVMHLFNPIRQPDSCSQSDLLKRIKIDLKARIEYSKNLGLSPARIVIDPGFGQGNYGKNMRENFYLLSQLQAFDELNCPILIGWSRKSMIGDALGGKPPEERLHGSIAAAAIAGFLGASIVRTHDVEETIQAMQIVKQIRQFQESL